MALLLAPYNAAMRIGAGFNSYTQQICVNQAVVRDPNNLGGEGWVDAASSDIATETQSIAPSEATHTNRGVSQLVSYTSRFVDKLSDVTDSMNISGSLSIKTNGIGGSGGGSFVDTNKFKDSDLNFFIQVKVINQKVICKDNLLFQPLPNLKPADFTNVFGDTFISGFLEGGEFNALVSIKIKDKEKLNEIKANLEVNLSAGGVGVEAKADVDIKKENVEKNTETSISVSWSGGGQDVKEDVNSEWDIASLTKAATAFADKVAVCPQRTNAILTKYSNLRSFYDKPHDFSPLDYENAGVYTSALLDAYMDYKVLWKNVQLTSFEVSNGRGLLKASELAEQELADMQTAAKGLTPPRNLKPYSASLFALDNARQAIRAEMIAIIKEVDNVMLNPGVALDTSRKAYLSPIAFKLLLPTMELPPPPPVTQDPGQKTLTQGPNPLLDRPGEFDQATVDKLARYSDLANDFRVSPLCGTAALSDNQFTHTFDAITPTITAYPSKVTFTVGGIDYFGWSVTHANGRESSVLPAEGVGSDTPKHVCELQAGEKIVGVGIEAIYRGAWNLETCPMGVTFGLSTGRIWSSWCTDGNSMAERRKQGSKYMWASAPAGFSFRSFYGYNKQRLSAIGVIWGRD